MSSFGTIPIGEVRLDDRFYPRKHYDPTWVGYLKEKLNAGADLGPLVVCKHTNLLLDGRHRYQAYLELFGPYGQAPVEWVDTPTDADRFLCALERNARHGRPLSAIDYATSVVRADAFNIPRQKVAEVLSVRRDYLDRVVGRRVITTPAGERIVVGRSWESVREQLQAALQSADPGEVEQARKALLRLNQSEGRPWMRLAKHLMALLETATTEELIRHYGLLRSLTETLTKRLGEVADLATRTGGSKHKRRRQA